MSKILFLYTDFLAKPYFEFLEIALKTLFRRFRKRIEVEKLFLDLSPSCSDKMREITLKKVSESDAVLFCGSSNYSLRENTFMRDCFGIHSSQYFSNGKCILTPLGTASFFVDDKVLKGTFLTDFSSITKTAQLAIQTAKARKNKLLLCSDSGNTADRICCEEFINSMGDARPCEVEYIEFDELIRTYSKEIPAFDVLLCPEDKARIIAIHTAALNRFPIAYSVLHGEKLRIHKNEILTSSAFSNLTYASMLVALSDIIISNMGYSGIGIQLRKSAIRTIEKCCYSCKGDFQKHLLLEINSPIRKRMVKINESYN